MFTRYILKTRHGYLWSYEDGYFYYTPDAEEAMCFDSLLQIRGFGKPFVDKLKTIGPVFVEELLKFKEV